MLSVSDMASYLHCCGQCVLKIETDNGQKFLYKPRQVQTEKALLNLINYAYKGIGLEECTDGCISRESYGWTAFVEAGDCTDQEQVKRYFKRLGAAICICYLLGTGDLHYENLIAHGEFPVPVDAEVLCSSAGGKDEEGNYSVLYSGILPDPAYKKPYKYFKWRRGGESIYKGSSGS